jgi:hypothetical protein
MRHRSGDGDPIRALGAPHFNDASRRDLLRHDAFGCSRQTQDRH